MLAYAINKLVAYMANPSLKHTGVLKRILCYLVGTKSYAITYAKYHPQQVLEGKNLFHGYADAAYANTNDYKSTSGYVFQMAGGMITWHSKKQTTIALSSTEAEYVALCEARHEACWLRNLLEELGESQLEPTLIKGDNDGYCNALALGARQSGKWCTSHRKLPRSRTDFQCVNEATAKTKTL
jgi:hypothetical protein